MKIYRERTIQKDFERQASAFEIKNKIKNVSQ